MRLILILSAVFSVSAFASEPPSACDTPVDLRQDGEALSGLDNIAQGYDKTNLCGFFAFSQFLDAWRIAHRSENGAEMMRASSIAIGVDHAIERNIPYWFPVQQSTDPLSLKVGRWGSTFCSLAEAVKEEGYCVDEELPTRTVDATAKFADITTFVYGKLLDIAEATSLFRQKAIAQNLPEIYDRYLKWAADRGSRAILAQDRILSLIQKQPTKPYVTVREMFFPACANAAARKNDFTFGSCTGEFYIGLDATGIPTKDRDPLRTERASRKIHELLDRPNATPIPFAYCSSVLREGKKYNGAFPIGDDCGLHWSLVAGRKKIDNECYLLVRNSWTQGSPAHVYSPDWIVEGGDLWVREKELTRAMLLIQWLKD